MFVITQTKKLYLTVTASGLLNLDYVQTEEAWVSHKNLEIKHEKTLFSP